MVIEKCLVVMPTARAKLKIGIVSFWVGPIFPPVRDFFDRLTILKRVAG